MFKENEKLSDHLTSADLVRRLNEFDDACLIGRLFDR
jgi:hypothetical protein